MLQVASGDAPNWMTSSWMEWATQDNLFHHVPHNTVALISTQSQNVIYRAQTLLASLLLFPDGIATFLSLPHPHKSGCDWGIRRFLSLLPRYSDIIILRVILYIFFLRLEPTCDSAYIVLYYEGNTNSKKP